MAGTARQLTSSPPLGGREGATEEGEEAGTVYASRLKLIRKDVSFALPRCPGRSILKPSGLKLNE